ncbi:MAG TPA: hypothetical protein VGS79_13070 [Puia sp.]|nr:hypothetical protein [Puia sp.]HLZ16814.1 hypothetical protein [Cyclobacteriaceae bacterium]
MAKKVPSGSSRRKAYLTKRILVSAARSGVRDAAKETMATMGYVIIAEDGWVIRKFADGTREKIEPIPQPDNLNVALD